MLRRNKELKGPIAWMTSNSVAANLLMALFILGGVMFSFLIKQEVFPEFDLDMISVSVPYPGASPEEIEQGIVLSIEEAVQAVDGVKKITSTSREGYGSVSIELLVSADSQKAYQDVQAEVDRITTFPENAEKPQISLASRRRVVMSLALFGNQPDNVLRDWGERLRSDMLLDPEITQVDLGGIRAMEISIEIDPATLRTYGLTLPIVSQRIRNAAIEIPGGGIKTDGGEILVRVNDRRNWADEFSKIPIINTPDGSRVLLGEIATVKDSFADTDYTAFYDSTPTVYLEVYRIGKQTPISVATAAMKKVEEYKTTLPKGIDIVVQRDRSKIFRQRAEMLIRNGFIGLALVLILLGCFLEIRLAFWVAMGIPISFLGVMLFMPALGLSINMISMFAFLIALGIVVDDAIVVGENIYEYRQRGYEAKEAATLAARDVATPVTFSVLTNCITFLPLLFIPGFMGKVFGVIPSIVCIIFLISLVECLFILPAHLAKSHTPKIGGKIHHSQQRFSHWFRRLIRRRYGPALARILRYRYVTTATAIAILIIVISFVKTGRISMVFMERPEADFSNLTAVLPYGAPAARSEAVRKQLVDAAQAIADENGGDKLLTGIQSRVGLSFRGSSGSHIVEVRPYLTDAGIRPINTKEFTKLWKKRVGKIPGVNTLFFEFDRGGPGSGAGISLDLSHNDPEILDQAGKALAEKMEQFSVISDIDDGYTPGKPQYDLNILPEGQALGLTSREVASQLRAAFYGAEALRQQRGRNEVKVMVRFPKADRVSEFDLEELLIRTPGGAEVPLREIAQVTRGRAYTKIDRETGQRQITVSCNVSPAKETDRVLNSLMDEALPAITKNYPGLSYKLGGNNQDRNESMSTLQMGFFCAMLGIYALLAIPFRSYMQPLIIMVSIPFGIVGAVIGHLIMGYNLSIISMMGIVALSGVVVNDSLVFIDYCNRMREKGLSITRSVHAAGVRRFRPIMLTTLTTFCGLAPMIFETSRQARFMIPMAISLGYGILFATLITLILVPCLYVITEDIRKGCKQLFG